MRERRLWAEPPFVTTVCRLLVLGLVAVCLAACQGTPEDAEPSAWVAEPKRRPAVLSADHHLHIQSEAAAAHFDRLGEVYGEEGPPAQVRTASDAIAALDAAGLEGGVVISSSYMFSAPDLVIDAEREMVAAENDDVAKQVADYPDRLVGLCSLNPLSDFAIDEAKRCLGDDRMGGLKLHLANSDVDLRRESHVRALAAVLEVAAELESPVLIHLRTRHEDYGATDVGVFIDLLSTLPSLEVQIAHMAGWGGYDDATDAALGTFVTALEEGRIESTRITFGLGAVVFLSAVAPTEEAAAAVRAGNAKLAERVRELGAGRVVYATDWPGWPPGVEAEMGIAKNIELVRAELPLTSDELDRILSNVGSFFRERETRTP